MAHTISGSLGPSGAGTTVFFSSGANWPQVGRGIVADASGNFTSDPLPDNATYNVTPVLFGAEFSPAVRSIVLVTSDITAINWSGVSSYYHLSAPDNVDSFNRGGVTQNPMVGWDTIISDSPLQIVADQCQGSLADTACGALPTGYFPSSADQYCQHDFGTTTVDGGLGALELRNDLARTKGMHMEWVNYGPAAPPPGGTAQIADLTTNSVVFSSPGFLDLTPSPYVFNPGDTLLFIARGNNYYGFLKQGSAIIPLVGGSTTSTPGPDRVGIELRPQPGTTSQLEVKNWAAGQVIAGRAGITFSSTQLSYLQTIVSDKVQQLSDLNTFQHDEAILARSVATALKG